MLEQESSDANAVDLGSDRMRLWLTEGMENADGPVFRSTFKPITDTYTRIGGETKVSSCIESTHVVVASLQAMEVTLNITFARANPTIPHYPSKGFW
jgi:hypothetical protein